MNVSSSNHDEIVASVNVVGEKEIGEMNRNYYDYQVEDTLKYEDANGGGDHAIDAADFETYFDLTNLDDNQKVCGYFERKRFRWWIHTFLLLSHLVDIFTDLLFGTVLLFTATNNGALRVNTSIVGSEAYAFVIIMITIIISREIFALLCLVVPRYLSPPKNLLIYKDSMVFGTRNLVRWFEGGAEVELENRKIIYSKPVYEKVAQTKISTINNMKQAFDLGRYDTRCSPITFLWILATGIVHLISLCESLAYIGSFAPPFIYGLDISGALSNSNRGNVIPPCPANGPLLLFIVFTLVTSIMSIGFEIRNVQRFSTKWVTTGVCVNFCKLICISLFILGIFLVSSLIATSRYSFSTFSFIDIDSTSTSEEVVNLVNRGCLPEVYDTAPSCGGNTMNPCLGCGSLEQCTNLPYCSFIIGSTNCGYVGFFSEENSSHCSKACSGCVNEVQCRFLGNLFRNAGKMRFEESTNCRWNSSQNICEE